MCTGTGLQRKQKQKQRVFEKADVSEEESFCKEK